MYGQHLSRDVRWYHVTFTCLLLLPCVRPADIRFCDTTITADGIIRIVKTADDNQHARCECFISPSDIMNVVTSYRLAITRSVCGEEFYFFFNGRKQFWRCSAQGSNTAGNNSSVYGGLSHSMWVYYRWKEEIPKNNTGNIEVELQAIRGNINVRCYPNDKRTKATTQRILRPTTSFASPTTTRSRLMSTERFTWGETKGATTDDPDDTPTLITFSSTVAGQRGGADDKMLGKSNNFIIIAVVVAVAVVIIIIAIIAVVWYRRRRNSTNNTDGETNGDVPQGVVYSKPNKLRKTPRMHTKQSRRGSDEIDPVPVPEKSWEQGNEGNIYNEIGLSSLPNHYDTTDSIMVDNEIYDGAT